MMKLVKVVPTRTYELTYLVPASFSESEVSTLKDKITQLIARHKGKLVLTEDWGKKNMAYAIRYKSQPQTQAYYVHMSLEMNADQAVDFEKEVYLEGTIMRHLLVKVDDRAEIVVETQEVDTAAQPKTKNKTAKK